jgi:hypothetical protein
MEPPSFNSSRSTEVTTACFYFHQMNCFSNTLRFVPIYCIRPSGSHCAKTTASCTNISENHESCCTCSPAFSHIGAVTAFANSMKFVRVNQAANMLIAFAGREVLRVTNWAFLSFVLFRSRPKPPVIPAYLNINDGS